MTCHNFQLSLSVSFRVQKERVEKLFVASFEVLAIRATRTAVTFETSKMKRYGLNAVATAAVKCRFGNALHLNHHAILTSALEA